MRAAAIADADDAELTAQRRAAEVYNAMPRGEAAVSAGGASAPPRSMRSKPHGGRGHVYYRHPEIGVYLPVRHGTERETLERTVGHVVGTSCLWAGQATCGAVGPQRDGFGEAVFRH